MSGNTCELFKMTPQELVEAKLYTLQKMRVKQAEIISQKQAIKTKENTLLLTIDFKAEGCTNEKQRTAYVNSKLEDEKNKLSWLEHDLTKFGDDITLINDLLNLNKGD